MIGASKTQEQKNRSTRGKTKRFGWHIRKTEYAHEGGDQGTGEHWWGKERESIGFYLRGLAWVHAAGEQEKRSLLASLIP